MPKNLFASPRLVMNLDDCSFYHTLDLPDHGTIQGFWDIRGKESEYLGEVVFKNKRVLEIGPATGQLSFFMDARGADVVSIEAADDYASEFFWDFDKSVPDDLEETLKLHREHMEKVKNSYWFSHRALGSKAKVHYGSAYSLPGELGLFDISVLACVLLHNKNPLLILENCARITNDKIIIVEPFRETQFAQSSAEFLPINDRQAWKTWWGFSPKYFIDVLRSMGFTHSKVTFHTQECFDAPAYLFTLVASRSPFEETPVAGKPVNVTMESTVERLRMQAGSLTNIPLRVVNLTEAPISSFSVFPIVLSYHWKRKSGEVAVWDGVRTSLPRVMHKGDSDDLFVAVRAPAEPGEYLLEVSMLEEDITWYDDRVGNLPLVIEALVTSQSGRRKDAANFPR